MTFAAGQAIKNIDRLKKEMAIDISNSAELSPLEKIEVICETALYKPSLYSTKFIDDLCEYVHGLTHNDVSENTLKRIKEGTFKSYKKNNISPYDEYGLERKERATYHSIVEQTVDIIADNWKDNNLPKLNEDELTTLINLLSIFTLEYMLKNKSYDIHNDW